MPSVLATRESHAAAVGRRDVRDQRSVAQLPVLIPAPESDRAVVEEEDVVVPCAGGHACDLRGGGFLDGYDHVVGRGLAVAVGAVKVGLATSDALRAVAGDQPYV